MYRDWVCFVLVMALASPSALIAQDSADRKSSWLDFGGVVYQPVFASASGEGQTASPVQGLNNRRNVKALHIIPLVGQNATNIIPGRNPIPIVVEVRDDQDLPVEGARVVFQLPPQGAGGAFADGQRTLATVTNSRGQAMARGFQNNDISGSFGVQVTATYRDLSSRLEIRQSNTTQDREAAAIQRRSHKWLWITLAGAAGAGAGLGLHYGLKSSPTYSVGAGPVTVGAPQ